MTQHLISFMSSQPHTHITLSQYPTIDIHPIYIQYMFSFIIILCINFVGLYKLSMQIWRVYQQDDMQSIIHDIYDKTILHMSVKYLIVSIICVVYFYNLTASPVQMMRVFWLYCLVVVYMKFDVKDILWPSVLFGVGLLGVASLWIWVWGELPAFKLIFVQSVTIMYFGLMQAYKITKILKTSTKQTKQKPQLSLQTLLQKSQTQVHKNNYNQFTSNTQLDQHIIGHLQNRRSFCIVFSTVLFLDLILLFDLEAGKELFGEVLLSVILDLLPLYVVFWYLRKNNGNQKEELGERLSRHSSQFHDAKSKRTTKIVIEMVNLKN